MKKIVVCGDSFAIGIGCRDLKTEPFGSLLAAELNCDLLNLAKGSCTNLGAFLQAKYAIQNFANEIEYVIVNSTTYDRFDWFQSDTDFSTMSMDINNTDCNYTDYMPYMEKSYIIDGGDKTIDNPMSNISGYIPRLLSDNLVSIIEYWEKFGSKGKKHGWYSRFDKEPKERMKAIYDYAVLLHDPRINRINSIGVLTLSHQLLKGANIKHVILTGEVDAYKSYISMENLVEVEWWKLSTKYPDEIKSLHTSPEGHLIVKNKILEKFKKNGWH